VGPDEVVARYEKIINARGRKEDTSNVKFWKSTGVAGKGGLISDKEFDTWIHWLVNEGVIKDGQLKVKGLYSNEFNPFVNEKK
jgi:hypothetical protein